MRITFTIAMNMLLVTGIFASPDIEWTQKKYPEISYLYRDHGSDFGSPEENSLSKKKSYESVISMIEEARSLKLQFITPVFFRFDLRARKVIEGGLEVQDKRTAHLIKKTRVRQAGNFLRASFQGSGSGIESVFQQLPKKLKAHSLTLLREEAYYQKVTSTGKDADLFIVLFPLKEE